jgi:hypothetical protein
MENWQLLLTVVLAIFVGACIPALVQLMMTLRNLNHLIHRTDRLIAVNSSTFERALGEVTEVANHLNRAGSTVETGAEQIKSFLEALASITVWVTSLRRSLGVVSMIGAAIAPAMGEAIRAFQHEPGEHKADHHDGAATTELSRSGDHAEEERDHERAL